MNYFYSRYRQPKKQRFSFPLKKVVIGVGGILILTLLWSFTNTNEEVVPSESVPQVLQQGRQVIKIEPEKPSYSGPTYLYKVQAGDNLNKIANRLQIELALLHSLNPEIDGNRLKVGETLQIPLQGKILHLKVQQGDSLWRISRGFLIPVKKIKQWNRLKTVSLQPGQQLVLYVQ